jgi:hypothetical protein
MKQGLRNILKLEEQMALAVFDLYDLWCSNPFQTHSFKLTGHKIKGRRWPSFQKSWGGGIDPA